MGKLGESITSCTIAAQVACESKNDAWQVLTNACATEKAVSMVGRTLGSGYGHMDSPSYTCVHEARLDAYNL